MLSKYNLELVPISHSTVSNTGQAERKITLGRRGCLHTTRALILVRGRMEQAEGRKQSQIPKFSINV